MDQMRAELQALADEAASHIARRNDAVERARAAGMTLTEISGILGMSRTGLRKALARKDQS